MKTINGILLVAAWAMTTACQIPLSGVKTDSRGLTLQFLIAGAGTSSSQSVSSARLLLPTVSSLTVTLTPKETSSPVQAKTVNIPLGTTQVSVAFGAVNVGAYTVQAQAYDGSGTLQFQQTGTLNLSPSQSSITLNLVPVFTSTANQLAAGQSVTGTLKAGTAQSWSVPATALISGGWNLQLTASPWVVLFAQDSDGAVFPPSATAGGMTTVQVNNGGTSFITLYNPTPSDQGFQFTFNQLVQFTVNSWKPFFDASFASGSSTTVYVDLTDSLSTSFNLPAGLNFAYQSQDGTPLTGIPTTGIVTINKSALTPGSTGFFMTITNPGAAVSLPGNREPLQFALDPTKVTAVVYALDTTGNQIIAYSLNEVSGALTPQSTTPLPGGFTPSPAKFILDPGKPRFYLVGTASSVYSVVGYNLAADGTPTQIGTPQSNATNLPTPSPISQLLMAITDDQYLYWAKSGGQIYSVPLNPDGSFSLAGPTLVLGTSHTVPIQVLFDPGYNLLLVPSMDGLSLYRPTSNGGGSDPAVLLTPGYANFFRFFVNSYYHTYYTGPTSGFSSSYNLNNQPLSVSAAVSTTLNLIKYLASNPTTPTIYETNSASLVGVNAFTLDMAGNRSPSGTPYTGTGTITGVAADLTGGWVIGADIFSGASDVFTLHGASLTMGPSGLKNTPTSNVSDVIVVRTH